MDKKNEIFKKIEESEQEMIETLCEVIRIPSLNLAIAGPLADNYRGEETKCCRYFEDKMKKLDMMTDLWEEESGRGNVVGILKGTGGGKSLMFNGHIDVVDPGDENLWQVSEAFEPKVTDGKIYGRGAADMKGGDVAAYYAVKAIAESGIRLKGDVLLEYVSGEEMMEHDIGTSSAVRRGYVADGAVVVEPTAPPKPLCIAPACCNVGYLVIQIKGKATHACLRGAMTRAGGQGEDLGVSAIDKAHIIYEGLRRLDDRWGWCKNHYMYDPGHFNIHPGVVSGGACGAFAVADSCTMEYSIWAPPQEKEADIKAEIEKAVLDICQSDEWLRNNPPVMFWPAFWPSYDTPVDADICKAAGRAFEEATKTTPFFHGFVGSNDASWLAEGNIPVITMGPGNLMNAHCPDEYVDIDELVSAAKTYAALIIDWCGEA